MNRAHHTAYFFNRLLPDMEKHKQFTQPELEIVGEIKKFIQSRYLQKHGLQVCWVFQVCLVPEQLPE